MNQSLKEKKKRERKKESTSALENKQLTKSSNTVNAENNCKGGN